MKHFLLLIFSIVLFTGIAHASGNTGIIKGTVIDKKTGEPMIGATVHIKNKNNDFTLATSTGLDGSYSFRNLPVGKYEVEAKYVSYKDEEEDTEVSDGAVIAIKLLLETKGKDLKEVTIGGHASGETDIAARRIEQRADQVLNAVSAKTIEVSPDITVANVIQRVSGVSLERSNNGEGQYAIIRGMDKRYTYTLINGFKIPSPDNKNRYVPLDIFPADIVERLEVYKSLTPAMEGDAIAGGVNMVLKDAPDDFTVKVNIGTGFSQSVATNGFKEFGNNDLVFRSPRIVHGSDYIASRTDFVNTPQHFNNKKLPLGSIGSISIGGRSDDKKFGALVSLSYQDIYKDTKGVFFETEVDPVTNMPKPTSIQSRVYNTEQQRTSAVGRFDYNFSTGNKLTLDAAYIDLAQNQYRYVSDTSLLLARTGIGEGRLSEQPRSIRNVQQIYNFSLRGDHRLADNFSLNWTAIYSKATANENRYELNLATSRVKQPSGEVIQEPVMLDGDNGFVQTFTYNTDQDKSGYLNLVYTPQIGDTKVEFTAGGMYRNKTRNSTFDTYLLNPVGAQQYTGNIDDNIFALGSNPQGSGGDALNYNFTENIGAAYGQFKFTAGKLQTLAGVRYEHTAQSWADALDVSKNGKTGSIKYYDFLPALNFKYLLSDKENLRATYYSAISRPNFYELIPHTSGDPDADYIEIGNTDLKHATANNYDLRYEFFPKPLDQFLIGVFYKSIANPIEYALLRSKSSKDLVLEAANFGTAHNYGLELDITKYISKFGFRANYSYTQSQITTTKQQSYKDDQGNNTIREVNQTRPLQGQSKHLGNLSLLYKDTQSGLDAQVSAVYTGERINSVSQYLNNDIWQKGFVSLDFSAEKRVFKQLYIYAKATNLLNTPFQLFIKLPYPSTEQTIEYQQAGQNTFVRKDTYQQNYIMGLHYKL